MIWLMQAFILGCGIFSILWLIGYTTAYISDNELQYITIAYRCVEEKEIMTELPDDGDNLGFLWNE